MKIIGWTTDGQQIGFNFNIQKENLIVEQVEEDITLVEYRGEKIYYISDTIKEID